MSHLFKSYLCMQYYINYMQIEKDILHILRKYLDGLKVLNVDIRIQILGRSIFLDA